MSGPRDIGLVLASVLVLSGGERDPFPLKVSARAAPGAHLAGEAIAVRVEVTGADGAPSIEPPRVGDSEVVRLEVQGPDPVRERAVVAQFVVVPRRSGPLVIPPFRARTGASAGSSAPIRLNIADVPASGRPSSFLGGVGGFTLHAEAEPSSLRAGQTLEYRLKVQGPAAWGSARHPDLSSWAGKVPGLRVEPLAPEGPKADGPPTRTFRYRLRPTRAGRWTLPPVAVSAFEPTARAHLTRYAPGVPIEVAEPPRLGPGDVADHAAGMPTAPASGPSGTARYAIVALVGLTAAAVTVAARSVVRRRAARDDPRRYARGLARRLDPGWDAPEAARRITEGLAEYLRRQAGRPPGALTPHEVHDALTSLSDDPSLPGRGRRLLEACDRARFGAAEENGRGLVIEAKGVLEALAKLEGRRGRAGEKPREAAETAKP